MDRASPSSILHRANGFRFGNARPVGVTTGLQLISSVVEESRAKGVLGVCSGAEMKPCSRC
jgi:hypothetical protein